VNFKNRKKGFTLVETMVVVVILAIISGVVGISAAEAKKNLTQTKVDSVARQIYVAAQENISKIMVSGKPGLEPGQDNPNVKPVGYIPEGCEDVDELYYITSEDDPQASMLIPQGTFDNDVENNTFIIEYDPTSGLITGVFYTEVNKEEKDNLAFYEELLKTKDKQLRGSPQNRKDYYDKNGLFVGYYGNGSDVESNNDDDKLKVNVNIQNNDILKASFTVTSNMFSDMNTTLTIKYVGETSKATIIEERTVKIGGTYSDTIDTLLDVRFSEVFKRENVLAKGDSYLTNNEFLPGENIFVYASATLNIPAEGISAARSFTSKENIVRFNSLFDSVSKNTGEGLVNGLQPYTAYIKYTRHLRNLDRVSSGFAVTKAVQKADITVPENTPFKPIENMVLVSYNGQYENINHKIINLVITDTDSSATTYAGAGLFGKFGDNTSTSKSISNTTLVNTKVSKNNNLLEDAAGALAGITGSNVTIENCGVMLTVNYKGETVEPEAYIIGDISGGLVGRAEGSLLIENSYAATVVGSRIAAGGLVGYTNSRLEIKYSYADCYLNGITVGGLVGTRLASANVIMDSCYAAGLPYGSVTNAAGLIYGKLDKGINTYTAFNVITATTLRYSVATECTSGNRVYYITRANTSVTVHDLAENKAKAVSVNKLGNSSEGNTTINDYLNPDVFEFKPNDENGKSTSHPYNYNGFELDEYPLPKIKGIDHYGDWALPVEAKSAGLIYWELEDTNSDGKEDKVNYYIAFDNGEVLDRLCKAHDDGGDIISYGYGYFAKQGFSVKAAWDGNSVPCVKKRDANGNVVYKNGEPVYTDELDADRNTKVEDMLNAAFLKDDEMILNPSKDYKFSITAYTTLDPFKNNLDGSLYLSRRYMDLKVFVQFLKDWTIMSNFYCTKVSLTVNSSSTYDYAFCPFFAADIVMPGNNLGAIANYLYMYNQLSTTKLKHHQIRSIEQFQFLNWNFNTQNCQTLCSWKEWKFLEYPFLNNYSLTGIISIDSSIYTQSHDFDATGVKNYTPIACPDNVLLEASILGNINSSLALLNWFGSEYEGDTYVIKNLNITSNAYAVGLFGVTVGARINGVIMEGNGTTAITRLNKDDDLISNYYIGGLIGLAADGFAGELYNEKIKNCAIGGYQIIDETAHRTSIFGGSSVGGLIGACATRVSNCSAVVDIIMKGTSSYGTTAVGGLIGSACGGFVPPGIQETLVNTIQNTSGFIDTINNLILGNLIPDEKIQDAKDNLKEARAKIAKWSSISNCYTGGSITFTNECSSSGLYKGSLKDLTSLKCYFVGGIVGSNMNTKVMNIADPDLNWSNNISILDCYTYMDLPGNEYAKDTKGNDIFDSKGNKLKDNIYSIGSILATNVTPVGISAINSIFAGGRNVILDCYYYKNGVNYNTPNNFIETEDYKNIVGSAANLVLKNFIEQQTTAFYYDDILGFGKGVLPASYNTMYYKGGEKVANKVYPCNSDSKGDFVFKTVISRHGTSIHVGEYPFATKVILSAEVIKKKNIILYIAKGESVNSGDCVETVTKNMNFVSKHGTSNICDYGYYSNKDYKTQVIKEDGTFITNTNEVTNGVWDSNASVVTYYGKFGYNVKLHVEHPSKKDYDVKVIAQFDGTYKVEGYTAPTRTDGYTLDGWYRAASTTPTLTVNGVLSSNNPAVALAPDSSGTAILYAGWKTHYDKAYVQVKKFTEGKTYIIFDGNHLNKIFNLMVMETSSHKTTFNYGGSKRTYYNPGTATISTLAYGRDLATNKNVFYVPYTDTLYSQSWKYVSGGKLQYIAHGSNGYLAYYDVIGTCTSDYNVRTGIYYKADVENSKYYITNDTQSVTISSNRYYMNKTGSPDNVYIYELTSDFNLVEYDDK